MQILDRRQFQSFLRHYALAFLVAAGLWVAVDAVLNLDEFIVTSSTTGDLIGKLVRFYATHLSRYYGAFAAPAGLYAGYRLSLVRRPAQFTA